jgi:hypothetical protein
MLMPKASVDENDLAMAPQDKVGFAWDRSGPYSKSKSHLVDHRPHKLLGSGIPPANARH